MKKAFFVIIMSVITVVASAQPLWPSSTSTTRAGARWWWMGSAVDSRNLQWNMQQYAKTGIGTLEITPIYGVQGNAVNELQYLSPAWMRALKFTEDEGQRDSIQIDMNNGTGWPFGGPWVPLKEAACKAVFTDTILTKRQLKTYKPSVPAAYAEYTYKDETQITPAGNGIYRVITLFVSRTLQKVKRAAPGGEGYVIDHFDSLAVKHYLQHFDEAFAATSTPYPATFFNDSYEVYGADWTPSLPAEFLKRRGYKLSFADLLDNKSQTLSDYRETLSDMLLHNFTGQWTAWAHSHGALTRNQAHGSPANLIDVYAAVDIPEIEGFGLSDFGIKGLRRDEGFTRKNFSDVSMLKYASSAAHITGKKLVSSETFTWLTEHFRTSLSQMKPDLDLMYSCGVNRMFFHGTAYSPRNDAWPGWKFYASVDMSPTNSMWRDASGLMQYINRCQSYLQTGVPDNDFLVYLPIRDMWANNAQGRRLMMFDIHSMNKKAPEFIKTINEIDSLGYDCDYISDKCLLSTTYKDGRLYTAAGTHYRALVIPGSGNLTPILRQHLDSLKSFGANIIYGVDAARLSSAAKAEPMRLNGLRAMRRQNDDGYYYFIANLSSHDVNKTIDINVPFTDAAWFNPMTGSITRAHKSGNGVNINLRSGESAILQTYSKTLSELPYAFDGDYSSLAEKPLDGEWNLSFIEETPKVSKSFKLSYPQTWETLDDDSAKVTMGTGVYTTRVKLSKAEAAHRWMLNLGDVRESARVYVNGTYLGIVWAVPFTVNCQNALRKGWNDIRIEVTNLPANRIADLDRKGVKWRKFNEINIVDLNYKKTNYAGWTPVKSGLNSPVSLLSY